MEKQPGDRPPQRLALGSGLLAGLLLSAALFVGCKTPVREESFVGPFDAQKVTQLSHEAYQVAWDAAFWARQDLRYAAFHPTSLDRDVVAYLKDLSRRVPWVAREIEKNPTTPRAASKSVYDVVAYDALMLRQRYQPSSFKESTCVKIERLLHLLDEMAPYYAQKNQPQTVKAQP